MSKEFDVFLSHNRVDKSWALRLKQALLKYNLKAWIDQDEIVPGDLIVTALEDGLDNCRAIGLIVSPESMKSGWVKEEYARAIAMCTASQNEIRLIPIILRDAQPLPPFLASRNWVDFSDESTFDQSVSKFVWGITKDRPTELRSTGGPQGLPVTASRPAPGEVEKNPAQQQPSTTTENRSVSVGGSMTGAIVLGDRNNVQISLRQAELSPGLAVDVQQEFASLRQILARLDGAARAKLDRALDDVGDEVRDQQPNRDEVGKAVERVLDIAKKASGFTNIVQELQGPVTKIVSWLGEGWYRLLPFIGLTA